MFLSHIGFAEYAKMVIRVILQYIREPTSDIFILKGRNNNNMTCCPTL